MLDFTRSTMDRAGAAAARAGVGLHQVRYVLAAAEHGGFRRAARSLGIQQSAVSRRIRELEERLGARLFERSPEGVRLTLAGEAFVRGATEAVVDLDHVVMQTAEHGRREDRRLRVGVLAGLGGAPLEPLLRELLRREPDLRIDLMEASGALLLDSVLREQCDVAFVVEAPKTSRAVEAWRERLMVAVPYDHPLASVDVVSWPQLVFERLLAPSGLARHLQLQVARHSGREALSEQAAGTSAVLRLVGLGQGLALVPEGGATRVNGVVFRPVARSFLPVKAVVRRSGGKAAAMRLLAILDERHN